MARLCMLLVISIVILARATYATSRGVVIDVTHVPELCDAKVTNGKFVAVHYAGKLTDGTEFDNSFTRGEPIEFQLGAQQVIPGWEEGILGMCVGEKRRLEIPPHLAYGDEGIGPIPGGATLVFDVELVRITDEPQGSDGSYEAYQQFATGEEPFATGEVGQMGEIEFPGVQQIYGDEDDGPAEWSAQ